MTNKEIFDTQIQPLLDQIHDIAVLHKMPFVAAFQVNDDDDDSYVVQRTQNVNPDTTVADVSPEVILLAVLNDVEPVGIMSMLGQAKRLTGHE